MAGPRRSNAATGAAQPSSAQLSPPKAIIDVPMALCAKMTREPRSMRPPETAPASDPNTRTLAPITSSMLHSTGFSRRAGGLVLQLVEAGAAVDEAVEGPAGEAEEAQ